MNDKNIFRVAAAQCGSYPGEVALNIQNHRRFVVKAAQLGVDYLVFPELSLTGYEPTLAAQLAFSETDLRLKPVIDMARLHQVNLSIGLPVVNAKGGKPYISAAIITKTGLVQFYHKMNLHPGEEVYFSAGDTPSLFTLVKAVSRQTSSGAQFDNRLSLANAICADCNHPSHVKQAVGLGAQVYVAGALISETGYPADSKNLQNCAREYGILTLMANHNKTTGGWTPCGKSAIWFKDKRLTQAGTSDDVLLLAQGNINHWQTKLVEI